MKTIISKTSLAILLMVASIGKAQTITISISAGSSTVITAVNSLSLSNPYYTIWAPNYGFATSSIPNFTVSPSVSTLYSLSVVGLDANSIMQTSNNFVLVNVPISQPTVVCGGSGTVTAVNSLGLSNPSYSLNPGGITSPNPTFAISPAFPTTYTLYVTGTNTNSSIQTTSNIVTVQVGNFPVTSVSPLTQTIACGPGVMGTATCIATTPTNNVTHNWYSPGSPLPLSSNGSISSFVLGGAGTYTCTVVDNLSGCTTSKTLQVVSAGNYPTFSLSSAANFILGCSTSSVVDINIVGANTNPGGGVVTYTILPPAYTGTNYLTVVFPGPYNFNLPGTYTVVVKDNGNLCESRVPISIVQNTTSPSVIASVSTRTLSCFTPSVTLQGSSNNANVTYVWKKNSSPQINNGSLLPVSTTSAGASVPSATLIDNYTLTVTDNLNQCSSNTIVTLYQNTRPPNAAIALSFTALTCSIYTVNATNNSVTGILPATFGTGNISSILWQGPPPQPNLTNSSTYIAFTPGVYTMTAQDMNNGCTSTATKTLYNNAPQAAFTHTIINGQATFSGQANYSNVLPGTFTNTSYFWDFGDGTFSTAQNPTHTYANGGAHLVKFKISLPQSPYCRDSVIQSVNITGVPCNANSNFAMVPTNTAQVWNVIPSYPWNIASATWSWGDGSFSNTLYTSHQYSAAGMYNICLTVTVSCVASSSTCTSYSVYRVSQEAQVIAINVLAPELSTGVRSFEAEEQLSWNIAPNPNSGDFQLNLNNAAPRSSRMYISDLIGRILFVQAIEPESTVISVHTDALPSGIYLLSLETNSLTTSRRIIVNR